jgi:hypothetical protein
MSLNSFFQICVSIFSIVATIFMTILMVYAIIIRIQIGKLIKKFEEIAVEAKTATGEFRAFIERTIESLEKFKDSIMTFEFIRKMTTEVISLIKNNKKEK